VICALVVIPNGKLTAVAAAAAAPPYIALACSMSMVDTICISLSESPLSVGSGTFL
jgi:hypothetical protein